MGIINFDDNEFFREKSIVTCFNPLNANSTKKSNTLKQFVSKSRWIVWVYLIILLQRLSQLNYCVFRKTPDEVFENFDFEKLNLWKLFSSQRSLTFIDPLRPSVPFCVNRFQFSKNPAKHWKTLGKGVDG